MVRRRLSRLAASTDMTRSCSDRVGLGSRGEEQLTRGLIALSHTDQLAGGHEGRTAADRRRSDRAAMLNVLLFQPITGLPRFWELPAIL